MVALVTVIVLMLIGAGALLVRGFMEFYQAETRLGAKKAELEALYTRNPFPSAGNLEVERGNLAGLDEQLADLLKEMGRGQIQSEEQSPPKFMAQFWGTHKNMMNRARERGVKVPESFDFGFGKHMSGSLPAPQDVARLTQQLRIVQKLCGVLFESGISEMEGVGRDEFEVDAKVGSGDAAPQPRRSRRGGAETVALNTYDSSAGLIPEGSLTGRWRFVFKFTAKEGALLAVLNRLAQEPLFVVVSDLEVEGDSGIKSLSVESAAKAGSAKGESAAGDAAAAAAAANVPRDLRIVCGRDTPLKARLALEVYQFQVPRPAQAAKPGEGAK